MGNQRFIKGTMANMAGKVSLKTPQHGPDGSIFKCHCGRQEGVPRSLCGLKLAEEWEEVANTVSWRHSNEIHVWSTFNSRFSKVVFLFDTVL